MFKKISIIIIMLMLFSKTVFASDSIEENVEINIFNTAEFFSVEENTETNMFDSTKIFSDEENTETYIFDSAEIFSNEDILVLNESINSFVDRTGYKLIIETIPSLNGESINNEANSRYFEKFIDEFGVYILLSKEDGDMIIKYSGEDTNIITDELIAVMMMSVEPDFESFNIREGLMAAIQNGTILIEENLKLYEDTHEVLEIEKTNNGIINIVICVLMAVIFIFNSVILFKSFKNDRNK